MHLKNLITNKQDEAYETKEIKIKKLLVYNCGAKVSTERPFTLIISIYIYDTLSLFNLSSTILYNIGMSIYRIRQAPLDKSGIFYIYV